jgi:hypothetical protein
LGSTNAHGSVAGTTVRTSPSRAGIMSKFIPNDSASQAEPRGETGCRTRPHRDRSRSWAAYTQRCRQGSADSRGAARGADAEASIPRGARHQQWQNGHGRRHRVSGPIARQQQSLTEGAPEWLRLRDVSCVCSGMPALMRCAGECHCAPCPPGIP